MIKTIKSHDSDRGIILYPHAGGYAEQLYVKDINCSVYGAVYPDLKMNFDEMCFKIIQLLHGKKMYKWDAIGSSMGGYVAFLVAHYYERYFSQKFETLHLFGVGCPKELILKLEHNDSYANIAPIDIAILKTLQIYKQKISAPIYLYVGNEEFFDDNRTIDFWSNATRNELKLIHTEDNHLPSRKSLCNSLQKISLNNFS